MAALRIRQHFEALADERRTILFSSQNTLDVEQISDQITFIDRGRIIDSADKETFLDRWRRLRLDVPPAVALPALPGIVETTSSGRLAVVTMNGYEPAMAAENAKVLTMALKYSGWLKSST